MEEDAPLPKYACCDEEHARGAWECNGCHRNFHTGCSSGVKKGERQRPECSECNAAAVEAATIGGRPSRSSRM